MATHCLQHLAEGRLSSPVCSLRQTALTEWVEGSRLFNEEDKKNKREGRQEKEKSKEANWKKRRLKKKTRQRKSSRCKRRRRRDKEEGEGRKIGEGLHQKEREQGHKREDKSLFWTGSWSNYIETSKASLSSHILLLIPTGRFYPFHVSPGNFTSELKRPEYARSQTLLRRQCTDIWVIHTFKTSPTDKLKKNLSRISFDLISRTVQWSVQTANILTILICFTIKYFLIHLFSDTNYVF
jgi:hypothetical protein